MKMIFIKVPILLIIRPIIVNIIFNTFHIKS